jgi:acetyl esterase/lipase
VNCIVASLSYRLAPEHPFPAAVHDAKAGIEYYLSSASDLNIDKSKISIGGFSAGGNLAIAASSLIQNVSALISFYPRTDFTIPLESKKSPGPDVTKYLIPLSRKAHVPPGTDLKNPLLSPMFADPDTLPKRILVITAEYDTSCAEGEAFAKKMQNKGKQVLLWRAEKCVHGWNFMDGTAYENDARKREAYQMSVNELKNAYSGSI